MKMELFKDIAPRTAENFRRVRRLRLLRPRAEALANPSRLRYAQAALTRPPRPPRPRRQLCTGEFKCAAASMRPAVAAACM